MRVVTGHAGGHPHVLQMLRPRGVDKIMTLVAKSRIPGVGTDIGKTQRLLKERLIG
jgi:hypothetical protein